MDGDLEDRVRTERLLETLQALVEVESPTGQEEGVARVVSGLLEREGLEVSVQEFEEGRYNVLGWWGKKYRRPIFMLNGHLDVSYGPLERGIWPDGRGYRPELIVADGRVWGLGVRNMKGALACYVEAVRAVKEAVAELEGSICLAFVGGEIERHQVGGYRGRCFRGGGAGARWLVTHGGVGDGAVIGEPTSCRLVVEHVGSVAARYEIRGVPAPLRERDAGVDAIREGRVLLDVVYEAARAVYNSRRYGGLGGVLHVGAVEGGWPWRCNRVPAHFSCCVEYRVLPDEELADAVELLGALRDEVEGRLGRAVGVEIYVSNPSVRRTGGAERVAEAVRRAHVAVTGRSCEEVVGAFTSDAIHLTRYGIPTVNYGPGEWAGRKAGEEGEWVSVSELEQCAKVYARAAVEFLRLWRSQADGRYAGKE
jgi:acetylornithine deacetylase/succinyl-diaminopimelate desuccinylase-like protein